MKPKRKPAKPRAFTGWAYPDEIARRQVGIIYRYAGERGTIRVRVTPLAAKERAAP